MDEVFFHGAVFEFRAHGVLSEFTLRESLRFQNLKRVPPLARVRISIAFWTCFRVLSHSSDRIMSRRTLHPSPQARRIAAISQHLQPVEADALESVRYAEVAAEAAAAAPSAKEQAGPAMEKLGQRSRARVAGRT